MTLTVFVTEILTPGPEAWLTPRVLLLGVDTAAAEEGAPLRWVRFDLLFVGGRERMMQGGACLASAPGLSATVWCSKNHLPAPVLSSDPRHVKVR